MRASNLKTGARLRVVLAPGVAIGPGKADLLEGIDETGSIAAAGRRLAMSYKRAWLLIEAMNSDFSSPLVETSRGGQDRGGATLTALGVEVLGLYRKMEMDAQRVVSTDLDALRGLLGGMAEAPGARGRES